MMQERSRKWPGSLIILVTIATVACSAGGKIAPAREYPAAASSIAEQGSQKPATESSAASQEVLIKGNPADILSSPEADKSINIELVLDASGSMLQTLAGRRKVDIAREVISRLTHELPANVKVGLRVYGVRYPESDKARSCQDIQLLTPLGTGNADAIAERLQGIQPQGWTPIAKSLELASQDLEGQAQDLNNVVLLSDGEETCDGSPTDVARKLKEGAAAITVHTIGFAVDEAGRKQLEEVAQAAGGTYNEAQDDQSLLKAVENALLAARSGTFLRGEIVGESGRKVSLSLWLQDAETGRKLHEFRSWVDSPAVPGVYDLLVGTAPRVLYSGVRVQAHTRTIVKISAGAIRVELSDLQGRPVSVPVHLKDPAAGSMLRSFSTWYNQPVLPGVYDLLVEANPSVTRQRVSVSAEKLTAVDMRRGTLHVEVTALGGARPTWETELRDLSSGEVVYRSLVGREDPLIAGSYRLTILAQPQIVLDVQVNPAEARVIEVQTGLLRIELLDQSGQRARAEAVLVDASQKEVGVFSTWEDVTPLTGDYQLILRTQPEIRRDVKVGSGDPTIIKLRSPQVVRQPGK